MAWRKKMLQTLVVTAAVTAFCVSSLQAGIITFDLRDASIEDIDEVVSFALTDTSSGLTATLTANIGELNQTNTGFGINAPEGGDDTDTIDDIKGTESVTITFNEPVTFDQLVLSLFSSGETASLSIAGGSPFSLTDTGSGTDIFNFTTDNAVPIGQTVVLSHESGNGFSFDNFTVTTVPEPTTLVMLLVGLIGLALVCRRRRA